MKRAGLILFLLFSLSGLPAVANDNPAPALPPREDAAELGELGKEMEDFHSQAQKMLQQLEQATGAKPGGQPGGSPGAEPPSKLDEARRKAMRLAADDRFLKSAGDLWSHPDRNKMLLIQLGFFLVMLIFKAWRQSRSTHWFKKLIVGFFFSILTWVGLVYLIPLLVLGEPFAVFTGTLFKVFLSG